MAKSHITRCKELNNYTRELKAFDIGDTILIQNGHCNKQLRWDNTCQTKTV